jgi:uncharacterized protein
VFAISKNEIFNIKQRMKNLFILLVVGLIVVGCNSKPIVTDNGNVEIQEETVIYDSVLAKQLGADAYGMKHYVIAFLKRGPNRDQDSATAAQLQRAHLDNIFRLVGERKLVLAGPFTDNSEIRGIYVFDVSSVEEAAELTSSDPAIKAGRLAMELHPWYGPAALMKVPEISKMIEKEKI